MSSLDHALQQLAARATGRTWQKTQRGQQQCRRCVCGCVWVGGTGNVLKTTISQPKLSASAAQKMAIENVCFLPTREWTFFEHARVSKKGWWKRRGYGWYGGGVRSAIGAATHLAKAPRCADHDFRRAALPLVVRHDCWAVRRPVAFIDDPTHAALEAGMKLKLVLTALKTTLVDEREKRAEGAQVAAALPLVARLANAKRVGNGNGPGQRRVVGDTGDLNSASSMVRRLAKLVAVLVQRAADFGEAALARQNHDFYWGQQPLPSNH